MEFVRTNAPTGDVVSLARMKEHLHVLHADEDALIQAYLDAATQRLDGPTGILGRAMLSQEWTLRVNGFSCIGELPLAPVIGITSVKYWDADGVQQTLPATVYELRSADATPEIVLRQGQTWPTVQSRWDAVEVVAQYGYTAVPDPIAVAIMLVVEGWFDSRGKTDAEAQFQVSVPVKAMLQPFRRNNV